MRVLLSNEVIIQLSGEICGRMEGLLFRFLRMKLVFQQDMAVPNERAP